MPNANSDLPHDYKTQRKLEKLAGENRKNLLEAGTELPPVCGYTYKPRKPKNPSATFDPAPVVCMRVAGSGTTHQASGFCDYHEVVSTQELNKPSTTKQLQAAKNIAYQNATFLGVSKPTDPHTALMDEISRTAGIVEWLENKMRSMSDDGIPDDEILQQFNIKMGFQPSVWYTLFLEERQHLVRTCTAAIKAGVAERRVQIAEQQGRIIAAMMMAFIHDTELGLTPEQVMKAPELVRKHLMQLPSTTEHPATAVINAHSS